MDFNRYLKFLNYGYFLSKYEPQFLKKLLNATEDSEEISEPLKAGKAEYGKEKFLGKLKTLSKDSKNEKDKERGIEPEL